MLFAKNKDAFLNNVVEGFSRFGIKLEGKAVGSAKDVMTLNMFDTIHDSTYFAVAKQNTSGRKAETDWNKIIDSDLVSAVKGFKSSGDVPAAALIIPSDDIDKVVDILRLRGLVPNVFQLISGYAVAGLKKQELLKLLKDEEVPEEKASDDKNVSTTTAEPIKVSEKRPDKYPLSKKLLAAALLGVTAGAVPFVATDVLYDFSASKTNDEKMVFKNTVDRYIYDAKHGSDIDLEVMKALAVNPKTAEKYLREIADTPVGIDVLRNGNVGKDILTSAIKSDNIEERAAAASNPSSPIADLERLSYDKSPVVRSELAKNPAITHDIMERLAKDSPIVCESLLENTSLTPDILDKLTNNNGVETCNFKHKLMANPCVSPTTLAYNAKNPDECIRSGVAENSNTPQNIIDKMVNDDSDIVKSLALKNPNLSEEIIYKSFSPNWLPNRQNQQLEFERRALLENPKINADTIKRALILDSDSYALPIAKNKAAPKDVIGYIYSVAKGKAGLSNFVINTLKNSETPSFADAVANTATALNEDIPTALRRHINKNFMQDVYNPSDMLKVVRKIPARGLNTVSKPILVKYNGSDSDKMINDKDDNEMADSIANELPNGEGFESMGEVPIKFADMVKPISASNDNVIAPTVEQAMFQTADDIVDEMMKSITPKLLESIELNNKKRAGFGNQMNKNTNSEPNFEQNDVGGLMADSDWLFQNSCQQLDKFSNSIN